MKEKKKKRIILGPFVVVVLVTKSCPTLCHPMDCSPPGSSVLEISQARIPEWGWDGSREEHRNMYII